MPGIRLEFGDAMRRLRDGETLVFTCPNLPQPQTVIWDARGLWIFCLGGWVRSLDPWHSIMAGTWYLDPSKTNLPPLPMGSL